MSNQQPMTNETIRLFPHDYLFKWLIIPLVPYAVKPNHITVFRFLATPFVLTLLLSGDYKWGFIAFIFVAFSDALDGSLARVRHQITPWGTFYDPVADKFLIGLVLIFIVLQSINVWFGILILFVEMITIMGGLYRKYRGKATAANVYGKMKMVLQVMGVGWLLLALWTGHNLFLPFSIGTFSLALVFAVISFASYGF